MKKRSLACLMAACMVFSLLSGSALAAEDPVSEGLETPDCICDVRCTEDSVNGDCPVCGEDYAGCAAQTPDAQEPDADGGEPVPEEPEDVQEMEELTPSRREPAVPLAEGDGLSPENAMVVPEEGMVIQSGTYYGISKEWYENLENTDGHLMYFSISVPDDVTRIAKDGFKDSWSNEKEKYKVITNYNYDGDKTYTDKYEVVAIDFSKATSLTTIDNQAAMSCSNISGVLDLSQTKVETIGKSAFSGCTGLTGVILPNCLKTLGNESDKSGSVFNGCSGLEFVHTADSEVGVVFDWPSSLEYIGKQCFQGCTGFPANTTVVIPESVTYVGSEAFDETTPSISTIIVETDNPLTYDGGAFKENSSLGYGLGKRLIIFKDSAAKKAFVPSGSNAYKNACTYEFTLHYGRGEGALTEKKLWGQAVNVCKADDGSWAVSEDYQIPPVPPEELPELPIGYDGGWAYNGKLLTPNTLLKPEGDDLYLEVQKVLQDPTIKFIVNGEVIDTGGDTSPELRVPAGSKIGVQVSHPVEKNPNADVYVEFEYEWIDVWKGGSQGPRMEEDGFGRYNLFENPNVTNTITINGPKDERTHKGDYTEEDYGDGYYLLIVYGYSYPKTGGQRTQFYQSANAAIASDPDRTVDTAYLFYVTIAEPITVAPANITVYMGGIDGADGVVNEDGTIVGSQSLPTPGFTVDLPKSLSGTPVTDLTFQEKDGSQTWHFDPYDGDPDTNVYKLVPTAAQGNIPLQFTKVDGTTITDDEFTVGLEVNISFEMGLYKGDSENADSEFIIYADGVEYPVLDTSGTLTVRGTTDRAEFANINDTDAPTSGEVAVRADVGTVYSINGSDVHVQAPAGVSLLFDSIINDKSNDRTGLLQERAETYFGTKNIQPDSGNKFIYEFKYLDLVDTNNGNAWVAAQDADGTGKDVTIYWPLPAGTNKNTDFTLLHFEGLHRDMDTDEVESDIKNCNVSSIELAEVTDTHIVFKVGSGGFSPFALVWETAAEEPDPGPDPDPNPGGGGGDSHSDPTGNLTISLGGNGGNEDFTFTVIFTGKDGDELENNFYYNGDYTGTIGSGGEITLTGGDKIVIRNLPEGTRYEVIIETADGYTVSSTGAEGVIHTGMNEAEFTATRTVPVADPSITGVSRWLNTTDHMAYLGGYGGGLFGPDDNMTRAQAAQMFYNLLLDKDVPVTVSFTDVAPDAWYATAVNALASLGIVSGYGNGTFGPDDSITRAQFTTIAMRFTNGALDGENIFTDVSADDWFYDYVVGAIQYGWISGYSDGRFGPNDTITRAQVTAIVNRMLGRSADMDYVERHMEELTRFTDVPDTHWAYDQIMEATNAHTYDKTGGREDWTGLT